MARWLPLQELDTYTSYDILRAALRPIHWLGSSLEDLRGFPEVARRDIGAELTLVQGGESPTDWKPMKSVGASVIEVRVHRPGEYRVLYVAKFGEAIYILHAFEKRTQKTPKGEIDVAKRRLAELMRIRRGA